MSFSINGRKINNCLSPYIIAEISANHNGSINQAKKIIKEAKKCGADAVKIQTYTADTMTINSKKDDFIIKHGLWQGSSLYDLYEKAETPFEWQKELFSYAKKIGITIFSTPFDESAVDLLETLDPPAYKISSFEMTDLPLIKYIAQKNKPMLISTGLSTLEEISETVEIAKTAGCSEILLFHCISNYPADLEDANLLAIKTLMKNFSLPVGLSDHTIDNKAAMISISLGACAIEKHFILNREDGGPDSEFSIEPNGLSNLVQESKLVYKSLGTGNFDRTNKELKNKIFRRSLYFCKDLKKGETITNDNVRRIRPGYGIPPKHLPDIIGKRINSNVSLGDSVQWDKIL